MISRKASVDVFVGVVLTASLLAATGCRSRARPPARTSETAPAPAGITVESAKVADITTAPIKDVVSNFLSRITTFDPGLTPRALVDRAEEAVPELLTYLTPPGPQAVPAMEALSAIGQVRGAELIASAKPKLLEMLNEQEPYLQGAAIATLGLFPGSLSLEQVDRFAQESGPTYEGVLQYLELSAQEQDLDYLERQALRGDTTETTSNEERPPIPKMAARYVLVNVGLRAKARVMRILARSGPEDQQQVLGCMCVAPHREGASLGEAPRVILPERPGKVWYPTVVEILRSGRYATEVRVDAARQLRDVDPERASAVYQEWAASGNPELKHEAENRLAELKGTYGGHVSAPGGGF